MKITYKFSRKHYANIKDDNFVDPSSPIAPSSYPTWHLLQYEMGCQMPTYTLSNMILSPCVII